MSGITVDRRDHVLITRFSFFLFMASTLSSRWSSTNGPFLRERGISDHLSSCRAGRARHLAARARLQLDVVDDRTDGDVPQGKRVAGPDVRAGARLQGVADL